MAVSKGLHDVLHSAHCPAVVETIQEDVSTAAHCSSICGLCCADNTRI